jgi:hypothetical protein
MSESYYIEINGKKYDKDLIETAKKAVAGRGDGRISKADAEVLLKKVKDGNKYTEIEKETMEYIRHNFKWTTDADEWFRTEIHKWAGTK